MTLITSRKIQNEQQFNYCYVHCIFRLYHALRNLHKLWQKPNGCALLPFHVITHPVYFV